jgi:hypothetical protein
MYYFVASEKSSARAAADLEALDMQVERDTVRMVDESK